MKVIQIIAGSLMLMMSDSNNVKKQNRVDPNDLKFRQATMEIDSMKNELKEIQIKKCLKRKH